MSTTQPYVAYIDQLLTRLSAIEAAYLDILGRSTVRYVNPNSRGGAVFFVDAADWGWGPSDPDLELARMQLLARVRAWRPLFELLFPHPVPEVMMRHTKALKHLERWLVRADTFDNSIPGTIALAIEAIKRSTSTLQQSRDLLPVDAFAVRAAIDTNVLLDDPDLGAFIADLGPRYVVHVLPVVLRELDELKRAGRNPDIREAAKRADRRLKSLRDNGDVLAGARVSGDVWAVFEHIEPQSSGLPSWLDTSVPDDRFVASLLLLQSAHPGSALVAVTGDLNLQTKLAAVNAPFLDR